MSPVNPDSRIKKKYRTAIRRWFVERTHSVTKYESLAETFCRLVTTVTLHRSQMLIERPLIGENIRRHCLRYFNVWAVLFIKDCPEVLCQAIKINKLKTNSTPERTATRAVAYSQTKSKAWILRRPKPPAREVQANSTRTSRANKFHWRVQHRARLCSAAVKKIRVTRPIFLHIAS